MHTIVAPFSARKRSPSASKAKAAKVAKVKRSLVAAGAGQSNRMDESPRGRILSAAAHLFLTRGYAQTTVRDLARAVGILSGSIFHHFESKEEILEGVMAEVAARSTERMQRAAGSAKTPIASVRELIRSELEAIHGESSEAMTLLATEWRSLGEPARARLVLARELYEEVWLSALRRASKELAPIEPFILRRLIMGMTSVTATWFRPHGPMSLDTLTDHILSLVVRRTARHAPTR